LSILKNLDVFVTVSNSTAHISGALGVPTIVICPKKSSTYYYWDYDNNLTPWYKSVRVVKFKDSIKNTMDEVNKLINEFIWK
jgi:ADP-heptose:LPS heptosyltransferase